MAKIEVETVTTDCWQDCEWFSPVAYGYGGSTAICARWMKCENVSLCRQVVKMVEDKEKLPKE